MRRGCWAWRPGRRPAVRWRGSVLQWACFGGAGGGAAPLEGEGSVRADVTGDGAARARIAGEDPAVRRRGLQAARHALGAARDASPRAWGQEVAQGVRELSRGSQRLRGGPELLLAVDRAWWDAPAGRGRAGRAAPGSAGEAESVRVSQWRGGRSRRIARALESGTVAMRAEESADGSCRGTTAARRSANGADMVRAWRPSDDPADSASADFRCLALAMPLPARRCWTKWRPGGELDRSGEAEAGIGMRRLRLDLAR